jgi:hypothetical protein
MNKDVKDIIEKIRKLQMRTTTNGCSQNEAMISAQKISDLMQTYRIKEDQINFDTDEIKRLYYEFSNAFGRSHHPVVFAHAGIEAICGVKLYCTTETKLFDNYNTKKIFKLAINGFDADVEQAKYLVYVIQKAIDTEIVKFKKGNVYQNSNRKVSLVNGFAQSMSARIGERLKEMAKDNAWKTYQEKKKQNLETGKDLVVVKSQLINQWLKNKGVTLRSSSTSRSNMSAGGLGRNAGNNVSLNKGVHGSSNQQYIGSR